MNVSNTESHRHFNVGSGIMEDFEMGALLHAILAWPKPSEEEELKTAANALCVGVIEATLKQDPGRRVFVEKTFPHYMMMDGKVRKRALRLLQKRLDRRMAAARMSLGHFGEGLGDWKAKLPSGMTRLSIDQLSKLVRPDVYIDDPQNIEKLIWRTSLPVVHLAAAFQVTGRLRDGMEGPFYADLNDIDLYRNIVALAYVHEQIMLVDPRFGKRRGELIRIRWVE